MKETTGYSIYNEDTKKRTKKNVLPSEMVYSKLPKKKFDIIYADPPWHYNGKLQFDKSSKSKEELDLRRTKDRKIFIYFRERVTSCANWLRFLPPNMV